jgi:hypothetical protein
MQQEQLLVAFGDLRAVGDDLDDAGRVGSQKRSFGRLELHFRDFEVDIEAERLKRGCVSVPHGLDANCGRTHGGTPMNGCMKA